MGRLARWTQRDHGQTTLEWLGIAAVVVALVAALVAAAGNLSAPAQTTFEDTACELVGDDCGDGGDAQPVAVDGARDGDGDGSDSDDGDDGGDGDEGGDDGGILGDITGGLGDIAGGIGDAGGAVLDGLGTAGGAVLDTGGALLNGLVLGDYGDGHDNPFFEGVRLVGQTVSGILIVGDIRDGVRAIQTGDEVSLGLIAVGLIPVYGDGIRAAGNVGDSVVDVTRRADDVVDGSTDAARGADDAADGVTDGSRGTDPFCSFGAEVPVLLADGRAIPIADVDVGDMVLAEDPTTGERGPRAVTNLWLHDDDLVDLHTAAGTLTTTADHPFWSQTDRNWIAASDLDPGDALRTPDGDLITVHGLDLDSAQVGAAHNLSVEGVSTYFVRAGTTDVLVHNQNTCGFAPGEGASVLVDERLQHGTRHLTDAGVLPPWRGRSSPQVIRDTLAPVLENPRVTADHVLGNGDRTRVFIGEVDGTTVAIHVFKDPPRAGQLATAVVPTPQQLANWGA